MAREPDDPCLAWHEPDIRCVFGSKTDLPCTRQATAAHSRYGHVWVPVCEDHTPVERDGLRVEPVVRSARHLALMLAGVHGSFDDTMQALVADREGGALVLLDLAEQRWLGDDGWRIAAVSRDWPQWDKHGTGNNPHVWFACKRSEQHPAFAFNPAHYEVDDHRCTCGLYKSHHDTVRRLRGAPRPAPTAEEREVEDLRPRNRRLMSDLFRPPR